MLYNVVLACFFFVWGEGACNIPSLKLVSESATGDIRMSNFQARYIILKFSCKISVSVEYCCALWASQGECPFCLSKMYINVNFRFRTVLCYVFWSPARRKTVSSADFISAWWTPCQRTECIQHNISILQTTG